jgi:DNA replication licensing factor MCM7
MIVFVDIGHLVTVRGLVTRTSDVKPRIAVCTYTCDVCGCELFQDVLGSSYMPLLKCPSQRCRDNKTPGKINFQARGSRFIKYQELRLQELPDQVPTGHIPRSMTVHCR